jgi:hypothetical protein
LRSLLLVLASVGCIDPYYDSDIGVEGVATDEGALAGTFAVVTALTDQAQTAVGEQLGGGQTTYLSIREYVGDGKYTETLEVCRVVNFEVAGLSSELSDDTRDAIPVVTAKLTVDHPSGKITRATFRETWAVEDLGAGDDLPDDAGDDRIFDMEDDGHPGATLHTHGLVEGELYFVQRKIVSGEGVVTGPDETLGLTTHKKESFVIDATSDLLKNPPDRAQHPDPKESWFHDVRVDDGADCGDVRAALDDGAVSDLRPFD